MTSAPPARARLLQAGTLVLCRDPHCRDVHPLEAGGRPGTLLFFCPRTGSGFLGALDGRPVPGVVLVGRS